MEPTTPYSHEDDVDSTHSSNSTASDGTEREDNNNNESQVVHEETRTSRSPNEALDEIRRQQTHNLFCPKCKTNITKNAELVVKNQETDSYKTKPYVLWVPIVISPFEFPTLHLLLSFLTGLWKKLKALVANCLPRRLSLTSLRLRFLLVAVLLLLSVIVLWSSHPPSPLPVPPSPLPPPGPPSPSPLPEPPSPSPQPDKKIRWLIHLPSIKYLFVFSLLFIAILTLPWPSISPIINKLLAAIKTCRGIVIPFVPFSFCHIFTKDLLTLYFYILQGEQERVDTLKTKLKNTSEDKDIINPITQLDTKVPPLKQGNKPIVDPPREPIVIKKPIDDPSLVSEPISIPISVPNPKEMWKYIVVLVQNHLPMWKYIVVLVQNHLPRELDILKSIVYGGLIESITSLGVVSSAVASGASTLNVISLGLASLSSGLIIICHNLRGLKTNQPRPQSTNTDHMTSVEVEDPYQTLLGNRRNFILHCVVVVLSFFFFGVIPPLCYAFSYRITDKGHYKAAVVLAASLVCVISLSFAKAYAFRMQKLRTMAEYTGMAFGASALSFIASRIASDIFEKLGFHELAAEYRKD
ncbi:hypothetical protein AXX17_AT4G32080 [Arabidopsis thaliana]|uniref:Membrane protein of ER body-like protein n=1 Tax=Arabidopsis thaliana TaxID=3702 RepID=A0A178V4V4_ARATH|nr:hypothetical protein AXX17_AT4G32080 [Arabidopsis thaliana]